MKAKAIFLSLLMIGIGVYGCGNETATSSLATQAQKLAGESDAAFTSAGGSLAEKLGLTQDQEEAITAIREEQRAAIKALIEEAKASGSDRATFREQKRALSEQFHERIASVLNDEQKALFEELKAARQSRPHGRRGKRAGGSGDFAERLGLTGEQQEAITAIREEHGAAIKALIEEAKAAGSDRESFREQKQALGDQLHEEILGILNDEQKALFEEMKSARHDRARGKRGKRARGAGDISEKLGLTADQQEQMTALKENRQAAVKALIEEARAAGAERGTVREQVQALRNEFQEMISGLLTEEQKALLEELKANFKRRFDGGAATE